MFKLERVTNNDEASSNMIFYNISDFPVRTQYVQLDGNIVYPAKSGEIPKGTITCGNYIRTSLGKQLGDKVEVKSYLPNIESLKEMTIEITLIYSKKNKSATEHEQNMHDRIKDAFRNFYFYKGQQLVFENQKYVLTVHSGEGFLSSKTKIELNTKDPNLTLISRKLIRRELFQDGYTFEEIGIGGLDHKLITMFRRALSTHAIDPKLREKLGTKHVKGILLHGPPGTGKTLIARKIGSLITDKEPKLVNGPEILNKFVGQSEENIRNLFEDAIQDQRMGVHGLHVIIFDEFDAISKSRNGGNVSSDVNASLVNQLLSMIDGVNSLDNILIIAMTNRKDLIDEALLRAGRIELHIEIGLPDELGREQIYRIHTEAIRKNGFLDQINTKELSKGSENFSGAEIAAVVNNAVNTVLNRELASTDDFDEKNIKVKQSDLLSAISEINPSLGNGHRLLKELVPKKYLTLTNSHDLCYKKLAEVTAPFKRILISGVSGVGKTTLATYFAYHNKRNYVRIIRPIDTMSMSEYTKAEHIASEIRNATLSTSSLVILDDIDLLMNYVKLGDVVSYSAKLYHTIVTLIGHNSTKTKLLILATCSNPEFVGFIKAQFDTVYELDEMTPDESSKISSELGMKQTAKAKTIRELLTM